MGLEKMRKYDTICIVLVLLQLDILKVDIKCVLCVINLSYRLHFLH